jgi:DNA modification methylase
VDLPEDWLKSDAEPADAEPQIDKASELNKVWKVAPGDLWQIGSHRLLCGDSTKAEDVARVMGGEKADMVFTDPPYGIEVVQNKQIGGGGAFGGKKNERKGKAVISANAYAEVVGDETTETAQKFYALCVELGFSNMILWGGNYFTDFLPPSRGWVCWDKIDGVEGTTKNFSDIELAWTSYDVPARIVRHRWQGLLKASEHNEKRCHPTQKPAALAAECFELYKAGAIIFDGFLGSGSSMVACQNLNRKCRGIEISPDYCAVILQRMLDAFPGIEINKIK